MSSVRATLWTRASTSRRPRPGRAHRCRCWPRPSRCGNSAASWNTIATRAAPGRPWVTSAVEQNPAGVEQLETRDRAQECRLARPRRPDDDEQLALARLQVHPGEGTGRASPLLDRNALCAASTRRLIGPAGAGPPGRGSRRAPRRGVRRPRRTPAAAAADRRPRPPASAGVTGVCRSAGMASRKTWCDYGARAGLRKAGDAADRSSEGTVRPPRAVKRLALPTRRVGDELGRRVLLVDRGASAVGVGVQDGRRAAPSREPGDVEVEPAFSRRAGTSRREDMNIPTLPVMNCSWRPCAAICSSVGIDPRAIRSTTFCRAARAAAREGRPGRLLPGRRRPPRRCTTRTAPSG